MKDRIKTVINNLTEKSVEINKTLISIDTNGNISIENFKKLLQCTDAYISLLADRKQLEKLLETEKFSGRAQLMAYFFSRLEKNIFNSI